VRDPPTVRRFAGREIAPSRRGHEMSVVVSDAMRLAAKAPAQVARRRILPSSVLGVEPEAPNVQSHRKRSYRFVTLSRVEKDATAGRVSPRSRWSPWRRTSSR
jgi:hypothetical protein